MGTSQHDTPEARVMRARIGAYALHSRCDSTQHTAPARAGFLARFEREVDPDGSLSEVERRRRAECALKAHMTRLSLASSKARARRSGGAHRG